MKKTPEPPYIYFAMSFCNVICVCQSSSLFLVLRQSLEIAPNGQMLSFLDRFGFIRDSPYGSMHMNSPMVSMTPVQCRENDYVHTSGVAFVRIPHWEEDMDPVGCRVTRSEGKGRCMGFQWMPNFMLTKRWRSAATGDQGASSKLRNEFEDFCADKNGSLEAFWESCKESARKAVGSRTEVERTIVSDKETEKAEQNREGAISDSLEIERSEGSD